MKKRNALIEAHLPKRQKGENLSVVFKYGNGITYFADPKDAPSDLAEKFKSVTKEVVLNEKVRDMFLSSIDIYVYDFITNANNVQIIDEDKCDGRIISEAVAEDGEVPVIMELLQKMAIFSKENGIDFYLSTIMLGKKPFDGDYDKVRAFRRYLIDN